MKQSKSFWRIWLVVGASLALVAISLGFLGAPLTEANAGFNDPFQTQNDK